MSAMPRMYAESTLGRMKKKLIAAVGEDTFALLYKYFDACNGLYLDIPIKKIYEIFNCQNPELKLSEEDFIAFSEIARHENHFYYVLGMEEIYTKVPKSEPFERTLIHECLIEFGYDEFDTLEEMKDGKPYYVPEKNEFLKYSDDLYFEHTPQFMAMADFFVKKLKKNKKDAMGTVCDIVMNITDCTCTFNDVMEYFEDIECFMTENQLNTFLKLYNDLHNNTRMPCNNGYTPFELAKILPKSNKNPDVTFGPNITNALNSGDEQMYRMLEQTKGLNILSDEAKKQLSDFSEKYNDISQTKKVKVGRNDLCPCGSGKKYKKCCGR